MRVFVRAIEVLGDAFGGSRTPFMNTSGMLLTFAGQDRVGTGADVVAHER